MFHFDPNDDFCPMYLQNNFIKNICNVRTKSNTVEKSIKKSVNATSA